MKDFYTSLSVFFAANGFSRSTKKAANKNIKHPWPRSPNITANKNGKLIMVYGAAIKK
jgi:hypothetical protein